MARYYEDQWPAYVSVADRRLKAEREAGKLRKKGSVLAPVVVEGRKIASTFWGKAWCDNLESYRDYDNRLERGRSYARNGLVIDLQIAPHTVTALVCGSSLYTIKITIGEVPKAQWKAICADCAGGIDSLVELLQGRFSKGVMERICRQGAGLFPKPEEIKFSCSCQDYASMCKHVAGALYGVGARLDARPELLFRLRAVDENELVANIGDALPLSKQGPASGKVLEADDMAALFGLDMADAAEPAAAGLLVPPVEPGANAATPDKSGGKAVARSVTPAKSVARSKETSVKSAARQKEAPVKSTARPKEPPPVQAIPEPMQRSKSGALKPAGRGAKAARPSAGRRARAAS